MTRAMLIAVAFLTAVPEGRYTGAQERANIVGTWKLVAASASTTAGVRIDNPLGAGPTGMLVYTADGHMAAIVRYGGRRPLSGADYVASPAVERAEAFATFFAYGGRYSVSGSAVTHHVEVASVENWINTDMMRRLQLDGNRLVLRTPPLSVGGTVQISELIWERLN